jgi:hypothetical protein
VDSKVLLFLVLVLAASGCVDGSSGVDGNGVKVESFSALDSSLTPGQQTTVEAEITSYNDAPTTLNSEDVELFNTGQLEVIEKTCTPNEIGSAREGFAPTMNCQWTVQAPGEDFVAGFESKPLSFKMRVQYESTLENEDAMEVSFQDLQEIEESSESQRKIGNGDVQMVTKWESPIAVENPDVMEIEFRNTGPGSIEETPSFGYTPSEIFTNCEDPEELIQGEAIFSCNLDSNSEGTRNLFISTSYKYEKSPNLDIEVVNN